MKKTYLLINLCFALLVLASILFSFASRIGAASRYAEFERAQCVNESAEKVFAQGKFIPGDRLGTVLWFAEPIYNAAKINTALATVVVATNIFLAGTLLLKRKTSI